MKVIYAGFSKCGTKTMERAFLMLGYKNYDVLDNFQFLHDEWWKIMTEGGTREDFRAMLEGVDTMTDLPACLFWEEILDAFPDCKVGTRNLKYSVDNRCQGS